MAISWSPSKNTGWGGTFQAGVEIKATTSTDGTTSVTVDVHAKVSSGTLKGMNLTQLKVYGTKEWTEHGVAITANSKQALVKKFTTSHQPNSGFSADVYFYLWKPGEFSVLSETARQSITTPGVPDPTPVRPGPPSRPVANDIKSTMMTVSFSDGYKGTGSINGRELIYTTIDSSTPRGTSVSVSGNTVTLRDLNPLTTYYFWARVKNNVGWGNWSARGTATTLSGVWVYVGTELKQIMPYVKSNGVWKRAMPMIMHNGEWKKVG